MASEQRGYHSYLLRLWQAGNGHAPEWRILLEDVRTRERQNFASVPNSPPFSMRALAKAHTMAGNQPCANQRPTRPHNAFLTAFIKH